MVVCCFCFVVVFVLCFVWFVVVGVVVERLDGIVWFVVFCVFF